jgi:hypothetical protein
MGNCGLLGFPDFQGLMNLYEIGSHWMAYCHGLASPRFNGLLGVFRIGPHWMENAYNLVEPVDYSGLSAALFLL